MCLSAAELSGWPMVLPSCTALQPVLHLGENLSLHDTIADEIPQTPARWLQRLFGELEDGSMALWMPLSTAPPCLGHWTWLQFAMPTAAYDAPRFMPVSVGCR